MTKPAEVVQKEEVIWEKHTIALTKPFQPEPTSDWTMQPSMTFRKASASPQDSLL